MARIPSTRSLSPWIYAARRLLSQTFACLHPRSRRRSPPLPAAPPIRVPHLSLLRGGLPPNPSPHPQHQSPRTTTRTHLLILIGLWLILYVAAAFTPPLLDDADATHAQAAQSILTTNDWVTLHVDGIRYLEKPTPPLLDHRRQLEALQPTQHLVAPHAVGCPLRTRFCGRVG